MNESSHETRELSDDELAQHITQAIKQIEEFPNVASLLAIFSSADKKEMALVCAHTLQNPETVAAALVNEAMIFGRQKEVLEFIRVTKSILDTAEHNINHCIRIQSAHN
jgi:hypothetical protein